MNGKPNKSQYTLDHHELQQKAAAMLQLCGVPANAARPRILVLMTQVLPNLGLAQLAMFKTSIWTFYAKWNTEVPVHHRLAAELFATTFCIEATHLPSGEKNGPRAILSPFQLLDRELVAVFKIKACRSACSYGVKSTGRLFGASVA